MANKFKAGMLNFIEVLNQMWDAFSIGPYNAVPLSGNVTMTGYLHNSVRLAAPQLVAGNTGSLAISSLSAPPSIGTSAGVAYEVGRLAVAQTPGGWDGAFIWATSNGRSGQFQKEGYRLQLTAIDSQSATASAALLSVYGDGTSEVAGNLYVGGLVQAGNVGAPRHGLYRSVGESAEICWFGRSGLAQPCVAVNASNGAGGWGTGGSVLYIGNNSSTLRSLNASGTLNASGADYAEYMVKSDGCATVVPGQIVGIDADALLTDKWDRAISFAVKSTAPCIVGGDTWSNHLGPRPEAPLGVPAAPAPPVRVPPSEDSPGQSDAEWHESQELYAAALAAHQVLQQDYVAALAAYDLALAAYEAELEAARQTVDRIAFAGQVPVNLQGATPGQFIVPVRAGDGITGAAVNEADMTLAQYMRAIGRVIAIEDDGRARIIVKVA